MQQAMCLRLILNVDESGVSCQIWSGFEKKLQQAYSHKSWISEFMTFNVL